jgi:hypothetical protein
MWPWADNAHVTDKYVKKLRQLINVRFSQQPSHFRDSIIIFLRLFFIGFIIHNHSPKF